MKRTLLAAVVLLSIQPASALSQESKGAVKTCDLVATMATSIMSGRQNGVTLPVMMDLLETHKVSGALGEWAEDMAMEAYDSPAFSTQSVKSRAIDEFTNKWYLACLKNVKGR